MNKYILIVTEKPDAARRIASALDTRENPEVTMINGVPYYVAHRDREIVVVPALGHLYTVDGEKKERDHYPVFNYRWVPLHEAKKGAPRVRRWLETITGLAEKADAFIDACDYDIEGSIIGYSILKYACGGKEKVSRRMKYSTLTKQEIIRSYGESLPHLDFPLIEAGCARHEIDWLYGINLSRALTIAAKEWSGQYSTLSTGRVQGPTLKFLVAREKAIKTFVPTPYWEIKAQIESSGQIFEAHYEKRAIETKKEALNIAHACEEGNGHIERIKSRQFQQPPPVPFDLGALQGEAYRLFGYKPRSTANTSQRLYLDALISYPRTDSQKLPPAIDYRGILKNLDRTTEYGKLATELLAKSGLKPNEGKKEDPAHPAIYPTGNLPERTLQGYEKNIWDLIVRRFMAVFGEPATKQTTEVCININGYDFHLSGKQTLEEGWLRFYGPYARISETCLPPMKEGEHVNIKRVILEDRYTVPPPRYNAASLLRRMERTEIGTKATRADIIQTLYDRNYVREEKMAPTDLGIEVCQILNDYCPTIISIRLTRELEKRMNKIQVNSERKEAVIADAIEMIKPVLAKLKEEGTIIGEQLSTALKRAKTDERTVGACPTCKTGKLVILHSRKTRKRFVGCTNYFQGMCRTSFPLPQKGLVKPLSRNCSKCGWPILQVHTRGKRPWMLCLNPHCPSKEERRNTSEMHNMQQGSG